MIALEMKATKDIMNLLLASQQFDLFLMEETTVTTFNTIHIDGHIVKDFYSRDELSELESSGQPMEFSCWKDIRHLCFQLVRGKKTPVSFKTVLLAAPVLVKKIAASPECGVAANLIRSLALNIRYENGKVTCITGSAFTTFIMDKSAERAWDAYVRQFLYGLGLDFEEI